MKRTILLLTVIFGIISCSYAQNNTAPKIGLGFSVGAPVGPISSEYVLATGLMVKFEYPINTRLSLMLTAGTTFFMPNYIYSPSGSIADFVPIEIGARGYIYKRFFIQGDAGVSFNGNSVSPGYTSKENALIISPSAGYAIPVGAHKKNNIDLSIGYENRVENSGGYCQVAVRAVFCFGL